MFGLGSDLKAQRITDWKTQQVCQSDKLSRVVFTPHSHLVWKKQKPRNQTSDVDVVSEPWLLQSDQLKGGTAKNIKCHRVQVENICCSHPAAEYLHMYSWRSCLWKAMTRD